MFSFLDAKAAKAFGVDIARFYIERMPLNAALKDKQFATKSKHVMDKMGIQIDAFKIQNSLNTYKIAQMGNAFKWTLLDAGYTQEYVDKLTQWVIVSAKT